MMMGFGQSAKIAETVSKMYVHIYIQTSKIIPENTD